MAEIRVKETGTIKLFESDNTSSVTIASPASLGADRTVTLPDADVTLVSGTMSTVALTGSTNNTVTTVTAANAIQGEANLTYDGTTFLLSQATPIFKILPTTNGNSGTIELCGRSTDGSPTENRTQIIATPEGSTANTFLAFHVEDSGGVDEKMRIASTGNVGIGVTDPDALLEVAGKFKVETSLSGDNIVSIANTASDGYGPVFKGGGTGTASQFVYRFMGYDGGEMMRMDGNGRVLVNSAATFDGDAQFQIKSANAGAECLSCHAHTTGNSVVNFLNGAGSEVGYITANASTTTYSTSSDYRLKENETAITDGIDRIKQLKPYRFNFKADVDKTLDGFFAHEVSSIVPEAISGEKDSTEIRLKTVKKADGDLIGLGIEEADWEQGKLDETYPSDSTWTASEEIIDAQGIDQAKLVPLLVAAVKELTAKVEVLENA